MLDIVLRRLLSSFLRLNPESRLVQTIHFFLYDVVKILFLLLVMMWFLGFLRSYLNEERIRTWLTRKKFLAAFYASLFGAVTPFCSCSSIPIFLSFVKTGIPLSVMLAFLITSPLINQYLVVLMLNFFGWKITFAYIVSGMILGISAGLLLGRMNLEHLLQRDILGQTSPSLARKEELSVWQRIWFGFSEAKTLLARLWLWILLGVALGAFIHNYVPQEIIQSAIDRTGPFSVPAAVGLGVPMYGSCAAIVPIAMALFRKGVPLGTALAFMMAVSALSLPEAVILRRAMQWRLIIVFFGCVTFGIIVTGYLFNMVQHFLIP